MTMQEWLKYYEDNAEPWVTPPGYRLFFDEEKGLLDYAIVTEGDDRAFIIGNCSTKDMKWFWKWCYKKAKEEGCNIMYLSTFRNPRTYVRAAFMAGGDPHLDLSRCFRGPSGHFYWIFQQRI